jgi:hypothetical protein
MVRVNFCKVIVLTMSTLQCYNLNESNLKVGLTCYLICYNQLASTIQQDGPITKNSSGPAATVKRTSNIKENHTQKQEIVSKSRSERWKITGVIALSDSSLKVSDSNLFAIPFHKCKATQNSCDLRIVKCPVATFLGKTEVHASIVVQKLSYSVITSTPHLLPLAI